MGGFSLWVAAVNCDDGKNYEQQGDRMTGNNARQKVSRDDLSLVGKFMFRKAKEYNTLYTTQTLETMRSRWLCFDTKHVVDRCNQHCSK